MQGIESIKASLEKNLEVFKTQKESLQTERVQPLERLKALDERDKELDSKIKSAEEEIKKIERFIQWDTEEKKKEDKKNPASKTAKLIIDETTGEIEVTGTIKKEEK